MDCDISGSENCLGLMIYACFILAAGFPSWLLCRWEENQAPENLY